MTREDFAEWKRDPRTLAFLKSLEEEEIRDVERKLGDGGSLADDTGKTAMQTARLVGQKEGIRRAIITQPKLGEGLNMSQESIPGTSLGNTVLVRIVPFERKTKGGIIIAENIAEDRDRKQDIGTILQFGPCAWEDYGGPEQWGATIGDLVVFSRQGGRSIEYPGLIDASEGLRLLNDTDILFKVNKEFCHV